jgi:hypothetical protein
MKRLAFLLLLVSTVAAEAGPITLGPAVVALNGPWKFHTGDDRRWADPAFDDSAWESVDLTPAPGAHDNDVGLTGYVPGWAAKGHAGYWGYAWYRIRVSVAVPMGDSLALAGPPDVDNAYQVFVNGVLLGSEGNFSDQTPVIYSIQPRMSQLPASLLPVSPDGTVSVVLAFRVWMDEGALREGPDMGGIHIAPALGEASAIQGRYRLQWLQTFMGYIVDATEPILFLLLVIMACSLIAFDRSDPVYRWLSAALVLTALVRSNQPIYFWGQFESRHAFDIAKNFILIPLGLGAWTMTWHYWFRLRHPAWLPKVVGALTLLLMCSKLLSLSTWSSGIPHSLSAGIRSISNWLRFLFVLLFTRTVYAGIRQQGGEGWLALPTVVLIAIGLFAQELSVLHVPGIWFPFGVGVSRTEYAYGAFAVVMFALLLRRLLLFAKRYRSLTAKTE